ncbi:MAG: alpha-amylase [bacterium]|nr:alpha-amylase [bacterium]
MAFLISRKSRDKYKFDQSLFKTEGNVVFSDFNAVQQFAAKLGNINARAGEINAMGLIHEISHHLVQLHMETAENKLQKEFGDQNINTALQLFAAEFPPLTVYRGEASVAEYVLDKSHHQVMLEEMMMLHLHNENPAVKPYKKELFDDSPLTEASGYKKIIRQLETFFDSQPAVQPGEKKKSLMALLKAPAAAAPGSLFQQLHYIKDNWQPYLTPYLPRLLSALDLMKEEQKFGGKGPGETPVYDFDGIGDEEYERFSADHSWMPQLVLMAKSTYVWLEQLSKKYDSPISRLDQIPDEELDELADRGFTGLWLIGLWERSPASRKIKQLCGNPEAMASAYSVFDYRIAGDLGGQEAINNLKYRAMQRGIRLAGDMVPNHMSIDSPWVVEHPGWFLSLDYCPYPAYTFNGVNLSSDQRVSIFLEDHYYDRTDAAVVFKWVDNRSGEVRYIYHGNDGTSMPWNDTAQLNYLNPGLREAVTNTIFAVAETFPIIRFDAAMTLSKKHYQRLWFPEPGSGGDIPTRAGRGMTRREFNRHMPREFWRNVVDRFAETDSDTLLLAEAFWLMETYFVRTLGMHRVYNSAFMNFLKNETNDQFRSSIKNVLQFNPGILKRFVNFLNNPDEETAVTQFGKDDKYFGVCTLMATLPGLPMFGHGQIEGFSEKYGMEYSRAYWDETPDPHLRRRHEKEIFPLLRKRYLFAEPDHFLLYDLYTAEGRVNEDVIAFSNRSGHERRLVVYHNKYAEAAGWLKTSVPGQIPLAQGLALEPNENKYVIFRDLISGLEYIRNTKELFENGLYIHLEAFKRNVFWDFREVPDDENYTYGRLTETLNGKGVPSIDEALREKEIKVVDKAVEEKIEETDLPG